MAATAKTKADVQGQSKRDRAWDELETKYSQERAESNKAYDQNKAAFTRSQIAHGMQRSSYGGQIAAGYDREKINAQNKSYENQIAAYQKAVDEIEQREADEKYRNAQLGVQYAQLEQQNKQFEAEMAYKKEQAELAQKNADRAYDYQVEQDKIAQGNIDRNYWWGVKQAEQDQANTDWEHRFRESEAERDQANTDWAHGFQEGQAAREESRWENEFTYGQMSDSQKLAYNTLGTIAANGGDASDELLAKAGVSRADFNAMKAQTSSGRSGSSSNKKPGSTPPAVNDSSVEQELLEFIDLPDKTGKTGRTYTYLRDKPKYDKFKPTYVSDK